jgi:SAM-dependent methyltransferase
VDGAAPQPGTTPADRNQGPILEVLRGCLPDAGTVLEIASGTGQHVLHFAAALPRIRWQPSEADGARRRQIAARIAAAGLVNVAPPLALDVMDDPWPVAERYAAIVCINMIHIAPPAATDALLAGTARHLPPTGALLYLYGPFRQGARHTAPSNEAFDRDLKARDPRFGVRDLEAVAAQARACGFEAPQVVPMPANNLSVIFRR